MALLLTFICFQIGWFASVRLGDQAFPFIFAYVLIHSYFSSPYPQKIFTVVIICSALGIAADSLLTYWGIFHFSQGWHSLPPLWFCGIWLLFTTLLPYSIRWLSKWPLWQLAIYSAVFAPASYYAGSLITNLKLGSPLWFSLGTVAVEWAILYPILAVITRYILKR